MSLPVEKSSFSRAIEEHLELKLRNGRLEGAMPIAGYVETVVAEAADDATASRAVAADIAEEDPPTETLVRRRELWVDPDSWWDAGESGVGWAT